MRLWVPPASIRTFHPVKNRELLRRLTASMHDQGWVGRPLLVEPILEIGRDPRTGKTSDMRGRPRVIYQAWTGAHRVPAARAARLAEIPVHLVNVKLLAISPGLSGRSLARRQGVFLLSLPGTWYDEDRMQYLRRIGDTTSADLLRAEIDGNRTEDRHATWKGRR